MEIKFGIVSSVHTDGFGFIIVLDMFGERTKDKVYFHVNRGRNVKIVNGEIRFTGPRGDVVEPGDRLAFVVSNNDSGKYPTAKPWTRASEYDELRRQL